MRTRSRSRPLSGPAAAQTPTAAYSPQLFGAWPRVGEGISWREREREREEGGVSGWVVLWSQRHSEKRTTAQDKHKQGHPLGRLTPRASVGACQPGLWPGGAGTPATQHPGRHPRVDGFTPVESLHQPARSPLRLREGSDSPDPPTNVAITSQVTTI